MGNIPPQAKKVFTGQIFDVYQWEQTMFDGSTETFEMLQRPNMVQILTVVEDKILVIQEEQPNMPQVTSIPGGRQDAEDATPLEAAKRELEEETGYTSTEWSELFLWEPHRKIAMKQYCFLAKHATQTGVQQLDPGERISSTIISFEEFITLASSNIFQAQELQKEILRMRLEPGALEAFRERLFS